MDIHVVREAQPGGVLGKVLGVFLDVRTKQDRQWVVTIIYLPVYLHLVRRHGCVGGMHQFEHPPGKVCQKRGPMCRQQGLLGSIGEYPTLHELHR